MRCLCWMRRDSARLMLLAMGLLWALAGEATSVWAAQGVQLASRSPRFLMSATATAQPVEVDAQSVAVLRRRITIDVKGATLEEALRRISRAAGLRLMYSKAVVELDRPMTFQAKNITVAAALTEALFDANVDVLITAGGQALLTKRATAAPTAKAVAGGLTGRVTDSKAGQIVAGAEVALLNTKWHTTTDTSGYYRFADVDTGTYVLSIRRVGYARHRQSVTVVAERTDTLNVALDPMAIALNELVTTATGQQRRRDIGNSITRIVADSVLRTAPIRNLTDLLEARVPGMSVQRYSGAPGDPARIRLRGLSSVLRGNDPVVIVDGIRIYSAQSERQSGNLTNLDPMLDAQGKPKRMNPVDVPAPSPLDQIDVNVIETIDVLKGPSAATLYGADAANGVIVITTKKGRPGVTQWSATIGHAQTNSLGRYPQGYYRWGRDIYSGVPRFCTLVDLTCEQDSLVQFQALNDPNLTVLDQGRLNSASVTASGGSQALTYSITGSFSDEIGVLKLPEFEVARFRDRYNREVPDWMQRPHSFKRWSVTSATTARLSQTADVTLSVHLTRQEQLRSTLEQELASLAGTYVDTVNQRYFRPGSRSGFSTGARYGYALDATNTILESYYTRTTASSINLTTGVIANVRPAKWFTASGKAGINFIPRDDQSYLPAGLITPIDSGAVVRGTGRTLESTFELQGTARKPLGWGFMFETNVGANLTTNNSAVLVGSATGLMPGTSTITGAKRIAATEEQARSSVFGWYIEPRITGQRFSLSTGLRLDGGSTYGTRLTRTSGGLLGGLLGLPKLNGSWVISEEPFFPFKSFFSSLQLRAAYGQAQVQPGVMDRLRLYTNTVTGAGDQLELTGIGNTDLRPERSVEIEAGFNAQMLDSRLSLDLTFYRKTQVDALMTVALPGSVNGGGAVVTNIGNIKNSGIEATLSLAPIRMPQLRWSADLNFSSNRNRLVRLGRGVDPNPAMGLVEGYPVNSRWARPIVGIADDNGDGVLQPEEIQVGDSMVYMGRLYPNYQLTMSTNVELFNGALGVTAMFDHVAGQTQVDQTAETNWVLARPLVDPTAPLTDQAAVLAVTRTNYGLIQTLSTLRFQTFSINYRPPASIARLLRARTFQVGLQGSNLGLRTNYRGKDPNVSAWSPGETIVDTGQLPMPRTWQLTFNLTY